MAIRQALSTGTSESSIIFYNGGHNHDGISSALINTAKYSIYDFTANFSSIESRRLVQEENFRVFTNVISEIVKTSVLGPSGITLRPNQVRAENISAGAVTATALAANIVLVNNIISSNNYVTGVSGWAIDSNGTAEFANTSIRGQIDAASLHTPGIDIDSNGNLQANNFALYSNGQISTPGVVISPAGSITANTFALYANGAILNGNFSVSSNGFLSATGANISGTVIATSVSTPGITIDSNGNLQANYFAIYSNGHISTPGIDILSTGAISSANFNVTAGGDLTAIGANIAGYIEADSGSVGNWDISAGNIISSDGKISLINDAGDTVIIAQSAVGTFAAINGDGSIELQNGAYGASQSMNGASYAVTDSIGRTTTITGAGVSGNLGYVGVNGIVSSGDIYAGLSYLSSYAIYSQGTIQAIGTITASGSGVEYGASNLVGGFPIALGYHNTTSNFRIIANNDTNVATYRNITTSAVSDRRLKDNIEPISSAVLDKFYSIKTYEFDWNDKAPLYLQDIGNSVGVMADELKQLYPASVDDYDAYEGWVHRYDEHPEGFSIEEMEKFGSDFYEFVPGEGVWQKPRYASVDYTFLIPHLISAVHDLNNRVKELESKV